MVSEENGDENEFASGATALQGEETSEAAGDGEGAGDETEPTTSTVTRRTTGEMEEGGESELLFSTERSRVGDPERTSLEDCRFWEMISPFYLFHDSQTIPLFETIVGPFLTFLN